MSDPSCYGRLYWCAKVPNTVSKSGEIYVMADRPEVASNGDLIFWGGFRGEDEEAPKVVVPVLALASGKWITFYAASCFDGHAIAVEHWEGEVRR